MMKYLSAYPFLKAAAWDIAITEDGPVVVEVNDFGVIEIMQIIKGNGLRSEIRNCYRQWRELGVTYRFERQNNVLSNSHLKRIYERE